MSLGTALIGTGAAIKGVSAYQQGRTEEALNKYNEKVELAEAAHTREITGQAQFIQRQNMRKALARNRVITAASGFQMAGTPYQQQLNMIDNFAYEIALIGQEGETKALKHEQRASLYRTAAKSASRAGKMGAFASIFGGVSDIATYKMLEKLNS